MPPPTAPSSETPRSRHQSGRRSRRAVTWAAARTSRTLSLTAHRRYLWPVLRHPRVVRTACRATTNRQSPRRGCRRSGVPLQWRRLGGWAFAVDRTRASTRCRRRRHGPHGETSRRRCRSGRRTGRTAGAEAPRTMRRRVASGRRATTFTLRTGTLAETRARKRTRRRSGALLRAATRSRRWARTALSSRTRAGRRPLPCPRHGRAPSRRTLPRRPRRPFARTRRARWSAAPHPRPQPLAERTGRTWRYWTMERLWPSPSQPRRPPRRRPLNTRRFSQNARAPALSRSIRTKTRQSRCVRRRRPSRNGRSGCLWTRARMAHGPTASRTQRPAQRFRCCASSTMTRSQRRSGTTVRSRASWRRSASSRVPWATF
eukprot:Opistho-1_new@28530